MLGQQYHPDLRTHQDDESEIVDIGECPSLVDRGHQQDPVQSQNPQPPYIWTNEDDNHITKMGSFAKTDLSEFQYCWSVSGI